MDPAESSSKDLLGVVAQHEATVKRHEAALSQQESLMEKHSHLLSDLMTSMRHVFERLPQAPDPPPTPTPVTSSAGAVHPLVEPCLPPSQRFSGDEACEGFLTQRSLTFQLQPSTFPSDQARIAYVLTLLAGKALAWARAVWNAQAPCYTSYSSFEGEFKRVFHHPLFGRQASKQLLTLRQRTQSAAEYAIQFRTLAAGSGWNDEALIVCFENGLSEELKDELATRDPVYSLERLIDQVILLDNRLRQRRIPTPNTLSPRSFCQPFTSGLVPLESPEPMQLGRTRLSAQERIRQMNSHLCFYCGLQGHYRSLCPELKENAQSRAGGGELSRE